MTHQNTLHTKLNDHTARVAIMGLGYVGLPLAVVFGNAGFHVTGIDPDGRKVESLLKGKSYIQDVPSADIARLVNAGKLTATTDFAALREADAVSICVPTPLRKTGDPDLSFIVSATEELAKYIHPGMVVVLESTTYPGTTRELMLPRLTQHGNLIAGEDFFLAFSPERVDPGREDWTTINTPKVIGGITRTCSEVAAAWYSQALQTVVPVSSAESAEMAKLLENTFRMVNIGLVNEMALMSDKLGVDVWEVIRAAASKPFGFMPFYPGPGLGGHCIPIDPLYLSWKLKTLNYTARFIELASEINTSMPVYVVEKVSAALNDESKAVRGSTIVVLGIAYKRDVDDVRESPALDVISLLEKRGAKVVFHDPHVEKVRMEDEAIMQRSEYSDALLESADCVVIVTDHSTYDWQHVLDHSRLVVDTRHATAPRKGNARVVML